MSSTKEIASANDKNNLTYCEFCGTLRKKDDLIDVDACASSMDGYSCCYAYKCKRENGVKCVYQCMHCQKIFNKHNIILINKNDDMYKQIVNKYDTMHSDSLRKFLCSDCYSLIPQYKCICQNGKWNIIHDYEIQCSNCHAIREIPSIQVWYGISWDEYCERYY
jgi:RNase P subunit RPR2